MAKLTNLTLFFCVTLLFPSFIASLESKTVLPNLNLGDEVLVELKNVFGGELEARNQETIDKQFDKDKSMDAVRALYEDISKAVKVNPDVKILQDNFKEMMKYLDGIDEEYKLYRSLRDSGNDAYDETVLNFITVSTTTYSSPETKIKQIHGLVDPLNPYPMANSEFDGSILNQLNLRMQDKSLSCSSSKSLQQMMQILLNGIGVAECKAFLIMEYSYWMLFEIDQVDYEFETMRLRVRFFRRFKTWLQAFEQYMTKASREVLPCDPNDGYTEDKNYFEMHVFQKYVVPDSDINSEGHCSHSCDRYSGDRDAVHGSCASDGDSVCYKVRKCNGKLYACSDWFAAFSDVWTCPAAANSTRRYDYVEHGYTSYFYGDDLRRYGDQYNNKSCNSYSHDVRSTSRHLRTCEVCLCICQDSDSSDSDQKINIRPVVADKDHVITSVKWVKKDHTLTLQIQQGKIGKGGKVKPKSVNWKDIQDPRGDQDIVNLKWLSLRGFVLENVVVPEGNVLVGVKLDVIDSKKMIQSDTDNMQLITPKVLSVPYDYTTGKLNDETSYSDPDKADDESIWDPLPPTTITDSNEANLGECYYPLDAPVPQSPVDGSWVLLTTSHFKSDVGQSTVPFFDFQDNVVKPPSALSGIGIYVKNQADYGGFLGLKMITFDQSPYVKREV